MKIRDGNAPNYSLFGCIFGGTEQGHGSNIVANGFGFFAIGRINDAQTFGVVKNATITVNKAYVGKVNSVILGLRSGTTYSSSRHAFFYVGYDMITTELVALKNCVNTLQTNLGRNVH